MVVTCSDTECKYCNDGQCTATTIDHTSDRFCTTGRRRARDDVASDLMRTFNPGCRSTQSGYKAIHHKTYR